jgi:hypothetical protein
MELKKIEHLRKYFSGTYLWTETCFTVECYVTENICFDEM